MKTQIKSVVTLVLLLVTVAVNAQKINTKSPAALAAEDQVFLKKNSTQPGVKVTASGLQYKVEKMGTGARPRKFNKVQINFSIKNLDGKIVGGNGNTVWDHRMDKMTYGMAEGLRLMPVGSKWILYMPANLCESKIGSVGDGRALVCNMELVAITQE